MQENGSYRAKNMKENCRPADQQKPLQADYHEEPLRMALQPRSNPLVSSAGNTHISMPMRSQDRSVCNGSPPSPRTPPSSDHSHSHSDSDETMQLENPYADDVINYMLQKEQSERIIYLPFQLPPDHQRIFFNMRRTLFDWLIEVQATFSLSSETLHLTFYISDFFISHNLTRLSSDKFQLIGVAAMFIASKYQEISPPDPNDFVYITDNSYTKQMLFEMEQAILACLRFSVGSVSSLYFFQIFASLGDMDATGFYLGKLFLEVSFFSSQFFNWDKSLIASSAVYLATKFLNYRWQTSKYLQHTRYNEMDVVRCSQHLLESFKDMNKSPCALITKYSDVRYHHVVQIVSQIIKDESINF